MDIIKKQRSWIEIDLDALYYNLDQITQIVSKETIMAVIKADAYGHGAIKIAQSLEAYGIDHFAVASLDEAIELRKNHIQGMILILGYTSPTSAKLLNQYQLTQTLIDFEYAKQLNQMGYPIQCHIKIDSGMHRLGEDCLDIDHIIAFYHLSNLQITGIFSHLCVADSSLKEDITFTKLQFQHFNHLIETLKKRHYPVDQVHMQSSYGLLNYPQYHYDYVRLGIAMYGVASSLNAPYQCQINLHPVLSLYSHIIHIHSYHKGDLIGYGRTYHFSRDSKIAVIPLGYADGYPRHLSNHQNVLIHGFFAHIVGRICMDQLMIDITDIPHVKIGDKVTIIGKDHNHMIRVEEISEHAQTISNEILSRMGKRLPKFYKQKGYLKNAKV